MKIHAGYEISYTCLQPTPMILMLSVHPSRVADLITPDRMQFQPPDLQRAISTASATTSALCYCTAEMRRGSVSQNSQPRLQPQGQSDLSKWHLQPALSNCPRIDTGQRCSKSSAAENDV